MPKKKKAIVRLPDGAGNVTFVDAGRYNYARPPVPPVGWKASNKRAWRLLESRVYDVINGIDKYTLWNMPNSYYTLATAFAEAVGGTVVKPRKPPPAGYTYVEGRVY